MTDRELRIMRSCPGGPYGMPLYAAYFSLLFERKVDENEARILIHDFNEILWKEAGSPKETTYADIERRTW